MQILIDDQRVLDVTPVPMPTEDGETVDTLVFEDAHQVLDAWQSLDLGHRGFRYGTDESSNEPCAIIVAEARRNGGLVIVDIDPHYDGVSTRNAYRLDAFTSAFDMKVVD